MTELLNQQKEAMVTYLHTQTELLNISLLFIDAGIRPPEELIKIGLAFAAREGFTQEEVADLKKKILNLPVKTVSIEGTA